MDIPSFLPGAPKDQPYICPHCQRTFVSFRSPPHAVYTIPAIRETLTVNNARSTCGDYNCWMREVDEHSEYRIAFFARYKKSKTPDKPQTDTLDGF